MGRLRNRKREISEEIEGRRAATRFEVSADTPIASDVVAEAPATAPGTSPVPKLTEEKPNETTEPSYTERLLKAKRQVWHDREKDKNEDQKRK